VKLAFLVPSLRLSGGLNVVVEHGSRLARDHGFDVTMVITHHQGEEPWPYDGLAHVRVVDLDDVTGESFDLAVATWWDTVARLPDLDVKRCAYFVQSLEDRFFTEDDPQAALAGLTYRLGLPVITEARWIADVFAATSPDVPCWYVRNGINKDIFPEQEMVEPRPTGPLRILVEGNLDDHVKGVPEALEAVARMTEPAQVTVVAARSTGAPAGTEVIGPLSQRELSEVMAHTDVVLKLSRVEGMSGPPLEAFHRGATCVLTPVTGHDEYLQHGWNGLLTGWDDPGGTARQLDLLSVDRRLLHFLRTNAAATARAWPGWDQATTIMAGALRAAAVVPGPDIQALAPLLREVRYQVARSSRRIHRLKEKVLADSVHIHKLKEGWRSAGERVQELSELNEAFSHRALGAEDRLARVDTMLAHLEHSRWIRLLEALEAPVRRTRPGMGSVRNRISATRTVAAGDDGS